MARNEGGVELILNGRVPLAGAGGVAVLAITVGSIACTAGGAAGVEDEEGV